MFYVLGRIVEGMTSNLSQNVVQRSSYKGDAVISVYALDKLSLFLRHAAFGLLNLNNSENCGRGVRNGVRDPFFAEGERNVTAIRLHDSTLRVLETT
jgi:hypothetical protein